MDLEMERQEILQKVLAFLSQKHANDETSFVASTRLSETGLIDSFAVLEVVMFLEENYGLTLSRADLKYIETPETITTLILNKQAMSE